MLAVARLNPNIWWYLARAGGLVAWGLLAASVFWGLWYSGRLSRKTPPRAWTLDLHRFLGALSLVFVAVHILALTADKYVDFGLAQVLVPFASHWRPGAVAWGITAFYLLLAVELTSWLMRYLPKKVWHSIHLLSFFLFAFSTVHAIQSGTDVHNPIVQALGILLLVFATVVAALRIAKEWERAQARPASRPAPAWSPPAPSAEATRPTPAWPPPAPSTPAWLRPAPFDSPSIPAWTSFDLSEKAPSPPARAPRGSHKVSLERAQAGAPVAETQGRRDPAPAEWASYAGLGSPLARRPKSPRVIERSVDEQPQIPVGR
ncbi:MAG: hypothetical protein ACRDZ8_08305 [Acidimicrobiales bacterium]